MRNTLILVVATLAFVVPSAAAGTDIEFSSPAQVKGEMDAHEAGWVAILVRGDAPVAADVVVRPGDRVVETETEVTEAEATYSQTTYGAYYPLQGSRSQYAIESGGQVGLDWSAEDSGYLLLKGTDWSMHFDGEGSLWPVAPGDCMDLPDLWGAERHDYHIYSDVCPADGAAYLRIPAGQGAPIDITGVTSELEWAGAGASCDGAAPCPQDTRWGRERTVDTPNAAYGTETQRWSTLDAAGSATTVSIRNADVFFIGDLSIALDGVARLPGLTTSTCDADCMPEGATGTVGGDLHFEALRPTDNGRIAGSVAGGPDWLYVDEAPTDPATLFAGAAAATTVAASVGAVVLYKFLAPLFTRMTSDKALEHPRRRLLHGFISEHPGTTFRELLRGTDVPAGTARHHLTIMTRTGLIVERRHRSTLRFFENHGRFDDTWDAVVLLREPELAELHSWLKDHPACMQKDILTGMQGRGWQRSTTQHRLNRLVDGGLVTVRPQGRVKLYTAHDEVQQPVPEEAWLGSGSFRQGVVGPMARP